MKIVLASHNQVMPHSYNLNEDLEIKNVNLFAPTPFEMIEKNLGFIVESLAAVVFLSKEPI